MKRRFARLAVALTISGLAAVAVAACGAKPPPGRAPDQPAHVDGVAGKDEPAGAAGGACHLLDYDAVATATGTRFAVAASGEYNDTYTCVLQSTGAAKPDLTLSELATKADAAIFKSTVVPRNAQPVADLGKAAYSLVGGDQNAGVSVEVGWLTATGRLLTLRYDFAPGPADGPALVPKLIELAKIVDTR